MKRIRSDMEEIKTSKIADEFEKWFDNHKFKDEEILEELSNISSRILMIANKKRSKVFWT